jgi:hypothetical protein
MVVVEQRRGFVESRLAAGNVIKTDLPSLTTTQIHPTTMQATRTALRLASRVTRSASLLSSTPVVRSRILPSSSLLSTFSSSSRHLSSSSSTTTTTSTPSSESLPIPEHSATCWSCAVPLDVASSTHCASCQTILPVPPPTLGGATYFQLLDLGEEPNFELDEGALKRVFLQKSRGVHPDGYKGKGEVSPGPITTGRSSSSENLNYS